MGVMSIYEEMVFLCEGGLFSGGGVFLLGGGSIFEGMGFFMRGWVYL